MKFVEFAPAARSELEAAIDRYELQRPGRGWRFYAAVERAVKLLAAFPVAGPLFRDVHPERGVRRRIVRGFPLCSRTACSAIPFGSTPSSTRVVDLGTGAGVFGEFARPKQ